MIFSLADLADPNSVFQGRADQAPLDWSSNLPDLSAWHFAETERALEHDLLGGDRTLIAQLAMRNAVTALRITVGRAATTLGFIQRQLSNLKKFYAEPAEAVYSAIRIVESILASDLFEDALDGLAWIPIVGWILDAIRKVVDLVVLIVRTIRNKREVAARRALARIRRVPIAQWSAGADQVLTQRLMLEIAAHNLQWMVEPRYDAAYVSDFIATPQVANPEDETWAGWLVATLLDDDERSPGLGFVPGTRNLHGAMDLRTSGGRTLNDLGMFFPTARIVAVQAWEMLVAGGPAMFSIDTGRARRKWEDYIAAAVEFGDTVLNGWSMSPTADRMGATKHRCISEIYDWKNCSHAKRGRSVKIPQRMHGHRSAYLEYIFEMFDPRPFDPEGPWTRDAMNWDDTTAGRALRNLEERQRAVLQSLDCMTVDDAEVDGRPRFRAIGTEDEPGPLWKPWSESVQAVFQSDAWRLVNFHDVPDGRLKEALRARCEVENVDCNSLGQMTIDAFRIEEPLGSPVPPTPPAPIEVELALPKTVPKPNKGSASGGLLLAGGVLAGGAALWHWTRRSTAAPSSIPEPVDEVRSQEREGPRHGARR